MELFQKKPTEKTIYDCNFSQDWLLGSIFTKSFLISIALQTNHTLDHDTLLRAVNMEITRNECIRLRLHKNGKKWQQEISDPYELKSLPCYDMRQSSVEEVRCAIDKIADERMNLKRDYPPFKIYHFMGPEGDYILFKLLHAYGDAHAAILTLTDIFQVYLFLSGLGEMPEPITSVEWYLKNYEQIFASLMAKHAKAETYFLQQYEVMGEPLYAPAKPGGYDSSKRRYLRTIPKLHKPASMYVAHMDKEMVDAVKDYCFQHNVTMNSLFMTAYRTYYSAINNGQKDINFATTMANRGKKIEKRLPFNLTRLTQVRTYAEPEMTFEEASRALAEKYLMVLRHITFDHNVHQQYAIKNYGMKSSNDVYTDMLYGRIVINEKVPDGWLVDAYWPRPKTIMEMLPIYMMAIDTSDQGLNFCYRYIKMLYDEPVLENLHNGMIRVLTRGMENPDITIGELLKEFT